MSITQTAARNVRYDPGLDNVMTNGSCQVWQIHNTFSTFADGDWLMDMFQGKKIGAGELDLDRVTWGPSIKSGNNQYSMEFNVDTADASMAATDLYGFQYWMEGADYEGLHDNPDGYTIGFWAWSTVAGDYGLSFTNNTASHSFVHMYTLAASTWTWVEVNVPKDTLATWQTVAHIEGLCVRWTLAAGTNFNTTTEDAWFAGDKRTTSAQAVWTGTANNKFYISNMSIVRGKVNPYQNGNPPREYSMELAKCQRYYEKSSDHTVMEGWASGPGGAEFMYLAGLPSAAYTTGNNVRFKVSKYKTPTMVGWSVITGTLGKFRDYQATAGDVNVSFAEIGESGFRWLATMNAAKTQIYLGGHWAAKAHMG